MQVHANNLKYSSFANMRANPPKPHNLSGAVSVDKVWLTFNASTLTLAGKPSAGAGNLVVRIQAKDSGGLSIYDDFNLVTLTALNQPPTLVNSLSNKSWEERTYNSYTIPANTFSDPNGDPLSYTARRADGSALPSWMTFNASTRTLSGKMFLSIFSCWGY